jgi:II/X family phage/plasmid replication protein
MVIPVGYDTAKLRSPPLSPHVAKQLENCLVTKSAKDNNSGELLYELTAGSLRGSWENRVSIRVMREEWTNIDGVNRLQRCKPYALVEGSLHKAYLGHNVFGGPTNFRQAASHLLETISEHLSFDLPDPDLWKPRRIDWAESYLIGTKAGQAWFSAIRHADFPRRKINRFGNHGMQILGSRSSLNLYLKGVESRYRKHYNDWRLLFGQEKADTILMEADKRLRVELQGKAELITSLYGKDVTIRDINSDDFIEFLDKDMNKLIRESKDILEIVKSHDLVLKRLSGLFTKSKAQRMYGLWVLLSNFGSDKIKATYTQPNNFYRDRKILVDAGISWIGSDVTVVDTDRDFLSDFAPLHKDKRRCDITLEEALQLAAA